MQLAPEPLGHGGECGLIARSEGGDDLVVDGRDRHRFILRPRVGARSLSSLHATLTPEEAKGHRSEVEVLRRRRNICGPRASTAMTVHRLDRIGEKNMGRTLELVARLTMAGLIAAALFVLPGPATGSADARSPGCPSATSQRPPKLGSSTCYGRRILTFRAYVQRPCTDGCGGTTAYCDRAPLAGQHDRQFRGAGDRSPQRQHLGLRATEPRTLQRLREPEVVPVPPGPLGDRHGALLRPGGTNMSVLRPPARPWLLEEGCDRRVQRRPRRHVDRAGRSGDRHRRGGGQGSRARTIRPAPSSSSLACCCWPRTGSHVVDGGSNRAWPGRVEASSLTRELIIRRPGSLPGLLVAERRGSADAFGYCGLIPNVHGQEDEPELAYEFLHPVWRQGYATEATQAVLSWAEESGYRRHRKDL